MLRALALGGIGLAGLWMGLRAVFTGVVDLGGKRGGTYVVTFADQPGAFLIGTILMLVLGAGALVVAWKLLKGDAEP
ncbi:MAG: hypothetical protein JNK75_09335 [Betaproteobacteria bacterium]|nr:hypothetical protein [Betaproteobacteria bacterium]